MKRMLALAAIALTISACSDEQFRRETGIFYEEIVTLPGGSVITTRYWEINPVIMSVNEIEKDDLPQDAEFKTIVRTVGAAPSTGITGLAAQNDVLPNTVVALFAGGRGPGNAIASRRAAAYEAGSIITGLQMTEARIEHSMAALSGQRVLISGGFGPAIPSVVLNTAEVFSFDARTFSATGTMRQRRAYHASTELSNGNVLITGGSVPDQGTGPSTANSATTEIFNVASGTFSDGPSMAVARSAHSAIALNDGRVLIVGGTTNRAAEIYTPGTNTFATIGNMITVHGYGHAAVKLKSGRVLITGGDATVNVNPSAAAEIFDPATNTFTAIANMTAARMLHFAVVREDGRVYFGGGRTTGGSALATAEVFDPITNAFTAAPNLPGETYGQPAALVRGMRPLQ